MIQDEQAYMAMTSEEKIKFLENEQRRLLDQVKNEPKPQVEVQDQRNVNVEETPKPHYERIDTAAINALSIRSFLEQQGCERKKGNDIYGMYLAQWRGDTDPSLKVDYQTNRWHDFGTGKGGTLIDLVKEMHNVEFKEACAMLSNGNLPTVETQAKSHVKEPPKIKILGKKPVSHIALQKYIAERGIDKATAMEYLQEVSFRIEGKDKTYFGLGFKNDSGGYELRNEFYKGCSSKDITTIDKGHKNCNVYEGFFDFLSYESLSKRFPQQYPPANAIILNSTINLEKKKDAVADFAKKHVGNFWYGDNDPTGKAAFETFAKIADSVMSVSNTSLMDCSSRYAGHKDLNEFAVKNHKLSTGQKL